MGNPPKDSSFLSDSTPEEAIRSTTYYPGNNKGSCVTGFIYDCCLTPTRQFFSYSNLFNSIILNKPDFIEEIPLNKIICLLNANSELLAEVGDYIKQSTELQK